MVVFIVPVRNFETPPVCLNSISQLKYPPEKLEVILVAGTQPSEQRNRGMAVAKGDLLYFLDDDSSPDSRALLYLVNAFEDFPNVSGIGGPSIGDDKGSDFQRCVAAAMSSTFGFGPLRFRYLPQGCPRIVGEDELILANFAIRNSVAIS